MTFKVTGPVTVRRQWMAAASAPSVCDHAGDYRMEKPVPAWRAPDRERRYMSLSRRNPRWVSPRGWRGAFFFSQERGLHLLLNAKEVYSILFGAGFTVAVSIALGSPAAACLRVRLYRVETTLFAFIAGAGVLSLLVTLLCLMQQARKGVFLWVGMGGHRCRRLAMRARGSARPQRRCRPFRSIG